MRFLQLPKFSQGKYTNLIITLIILFFFSPLVTGAIGNLLLAFWFFAANLSVIETFSLASVKVNILKLIAIVGCVLDTIASFYSRTEKPFLLMAFGCYLLFLISAVFVIGKRIFLARKVDGDILMGGICIYLILGFIWVLFYRIIFLIAPNSFPNITLESDSYQLIYFSFTTLTTLGYGDITPANRLAMTLANAEAIVGQMYPAIFIARLVSLYSFEEFEE